ncbi:MULTISPECIES: hypothetical protein [unclassified Tolypothrix]|nr:MULTISPECIES: hypothetical protein [unclassified Tolypothrix]
MFGEFTDTTTAIAPDKFTNQESFTRQAGEGDGAATVRVIV